MGVLLDILGSFVIRAAVVLIILTTMITLNNSLFRQTERVALNELVSGIGETVFNDLSHAGYNSTSKTFNKADSIETIFFADLDNNGSVETIRYYLGSGASGSHRILYRTLNSGTAFEIARDVILLRFYYYNITGGTVSYGNNRTGIKSVKVSITIESSHKLVSVYSGTSDTLSYQQAKWEAHIFPSNQ
ncbi:MAG: hypothetical protein WDA22_05080 [Bacteroidota bacterium]